MKVAWIRYLIDNILEPLGYALNGVVEWQEVFKMTHPFKEQKEFIFKPEFKGYRAEDSSYYIAERYISVKSIYYTYVQFDIVEIRATIERTYNRNIDCWVFYMDNLIYPFANYLGLIVDNKAVGACASDLLHQIFVKYVYKEYNTDDEDTVKVSKYFPDHWNSLLKLKSMEQK